MLEILLPYVMVAMREGVMPKLGTFINQCLDRGVWPPAPEHLPPTIEIGEPMVRAICGFLQRMVESGNEVGCGVYYDNDSNTLVKGQVIEGAPHAVRIPTAGGDPSRVPVGTIHTHYESDEEFRGVESPPSMADFLLLQNPGITFMIVVSGTPRRPYYYLIMKTTASSFGDGVAKSEFEEASERNIATIHADLVTNHRHNIGRAMGIALHQDMASTAEMFKIVAYGGCFNELKKL